MGMPGRMYAATNSYRYGFNGKENDNEIKGLGYQQDYGMRIYDTRIGKFLSVDPLTKSYPMLTPYQFSSNSPIWCIDLDGGEGKTATEYLVDLMNWLGDSENEWDNINRGEGPIGRKLDWFNRSINPIGIVGYNGYTVATGRDLEKPGRFSRTDAAGNLIIAYIFHRSVSIAASPTTSTILQREMAKNQAAMGSTAAVKAALEDANAANAAGAKDWSKYRMTGNVPEWGVPAASNSVTTIKGFSIPGNSVVLGKDFTGKLAQQAIDVGGYHFGTWGKPFGVQGLTFSNQFFKVLDDIVKSGGKIFMDVENVNISLARKGVGTFAEAAEKKLATEWELNQILGNKDFLKNTIFHQNGKVLSAEELVKKGINQ